MIKLSVIIVNYNVAYFLEQCLLSVQVACKNISSEIIVVDNNSSDKSCTVIRKKFSSVQCIENKNNIGFSRANNLGVAVAEGEYILILNPDTIVAEDTLDQVLFFAEQQEDLGAVGVKFIDGTGHFLPECKRNTPTFEIASRKLLGDSKKYYANQIDKNGVAEVEILTGAFMLMKREIYLKVGGLDEDYFMFGEDIDLSYKLLNQGFQNYYFGKTAIIHYKGESTVKDKNYLRNFYGAMQIFYKKHFKVNAFYNLLSKIAIKTMILTKSNVVLHNSSQKRKINNVLFISNDRKKFARIQMKLAPVKVSLSANLPVDVSTYEKIIFDNSLLSFKEIIQIFQQLKNTKIVMRIVPANRVYFIGSDSSIVKGEVLIF